MIYKGIDLNKFTSAEMIEFISTKFHYEQLCIIAMIVDGDKNKYEEDITKYKHYDVLLKYNKHVLFIYKNNNYFYDDMDIECIVKYKKDNIIFKVCNRDKNMDLYDEYGTKYNSIVCEPCTIKEMRKIKTDYLLKL